MVGALDARTKNELIYARCRKEGYNVVAMAHNLDDLAENFMMAAFDQGKLRALSAHQHLDNKLRVIRPLIYCREGLIKDFVKKANLPLIPDSNPSSSKFSKKRQGIKTILS